MTVSFESKLFPTSFSLYLKVSFDEEVDKTDSLRERLALLLFDRLLLPFPVEPEVAPRFPGNPTGKNPDDPDSRCCNEW